MRTVIAPFLKWDFQKGRYFHIQQKSECQRRQFLSQQAEGLAPFLIPKKGTIEKAAWISESANINATISIRNFHLVLRRNAQIALLALDGYRLF
mgnify:FL=1